jgi:hypothetical protein
MMLTASSSEARQTRKRDSADGTGFWRTTFIGVDAGVRGVASVPDEPMPESAALYPVAFLIELDPNAVLGQHFHRANQFQVFVAGNGQLGKHAVESVFVHYANAYSAYGPVCAGGAGLHFLTLRDAWDPGARFLPGAMAELRAARGHPRQAYAGPVRVAPSRDRCATTGASCEPLLSTEPDGLGAWLHRLPPGASIGGPAPRSGGGQYWLVLSGALHRQGGAPLPPLSCAFVSSDEAPFTASAAQDGTEILCLQFPAGTMARRKREDGVASAA